MIPHGGNKVNYFLEFFQKNLNLLPLYDMILLKVGDLMSTIYERIKERRLELGLTVEDLAKKMGYKDKSSISKIENGKADIPQSKVMAFARALETTTAYLMGIDEEKERPPLPAGAIPVRAGPMIPVLGQVRCGLPMYAEENIEGYVSYQGNSGEQYFALRATGDSMNAAGISDGDTVIIRQQDTVDPNTIAVVCVNGDEATLKRFRQEGDIVFLSPQSYDPNYQVQVYDLKKTPVHIMGRVMEVRKTF